ncbi:NO-inducible flavohemoprotein [Bacillus velezensis]|uniref:NO-inducible flavohemoprotein n=1 Tax=Bacillus amyloliquefaciens group TaxID=1938374 RepID=UPI000F03D083|nr:MULTISPECIES: NO-inducible flavohemoprotein [Bacillus amyloliquefaciens group]AZJ43421.1 NO-inducible flavohemoprotein [Bacillus velezensis]MCP1563208.1 nitric oxide dioxygenase [Bacillus velezensis]MCR4371351.1 NO-inducible flavohemoprotein [Bacillus amyloliquefaciens]MEC1133233.1 NO-inducible flavohemoprotein [Bacillus velezensis]MEC2355026.1 NO-inducible flavohemoprotein [Bacillus velezensis]
MLDEKTIEIIKSTVPVLEEHGEEITGRFYDLLFQHHPELLNIFNQTNQKKKTQRTALSNAVIAAAANIDRLENIVPVVKQISHKHRSIGVKPEHYPIVGKYLLIAIKDVLKDGAAPEVIQAWEKAYGVIADAFIGIEKDMYEQAETQKGGWKDYKAFQIDKKVKESKEITSFYLKPEDGQVLPEFKAGQYISVKVYIPDTGYTHIRQYSLSDVSGKDYYRISVKKEGIVSSYLHDQLHEKDSIEISAPAGDFVLDSDSKKNLVLISAGVGITPMISMLKTVAKTQPQRNVLFIHAARSGEYHALRHEAEEAAEHSSVDTLFIYSEPSEQDRSENIRFREGRIDKQLLEEVMTDKDADFYLCGSPSFIKEMKKLISEFNTPPESIHYELFEPQLSMV